MKKLLSLCLLLLTAIAGWAQTTFTQGNFTYTVTDDENDYVSVAENSENKPTGAITIPSSVTYETVKYTVTSIANSGFSYNTGITGVTLPNTLTNIGDFAFYGCSSLASFSVPASVTTIGSDAFYTCSIPTFTFEASNTAITCNTGIPCTDHLFLYRDVNMEGYQLTTGAIKALTIGADVSTIYTNMFNGCTLLSSIDFSAATGLTSIENYAFNNCGTFVPEPEADPVPNLTTIDLSNTKVTSIGDNAFSACNKLTTITLPSTLQTIGDFAFYGCSSLASFSVPGSVTTIGTDAFYTCSIPTFTFEASNTTITCNTVIPCTDHLYLNRDVVKDGALTEGNVKALTIGANVTTIYTNMFNGCTLLSSIDFSAATGLTSIGNFAFYDCGNYVPTEPGEDLVPNLTAIDLSNTKVTSIGQSAFNSCSKLETITLPSTLTSICDYAFQDCRSLVSFSLPGSVTTISSDAFFNCSIPTFTFEASNTPLTWNTTVPCSGHLSLYRNLVDGNMPNGLKAVTIGENVTGIGTMFYEAAQLENVYVPWLSSPINIAAGAFSETTYTSATLWIPGGTGDIYDAADGWKNFTKKDFSSFVVSITGSAHGTLAVADISSTNNETETTLIDRGEDAKFTVTPAIGYKLNTFTVNEVAATPTEGSYTVEDLSADQTVVAGFTPITYTLTYTMNGGTATPANPTTYTIETPTFTLTNPTKTGYTFKGWKLNGEGDAMMTVTITQGSTGHIAYTATWQVNQYTITFDSNGGTEIDAIKQDYATEVEAPTNPERTGYTFAGWTPEVPATIPAENITCVAQWTINQYTITFNTAGGSVIAPIVQDYATAVVAPANPTRDGYTFAGWDKAIPATIPAENVTINATWTPVNYTISYDLAGGSVASANPTSYNIESAPITLINPTKDGYDFAGWTGTGLDAATKTVIIATGNTGDRSYTATWTKKTYTVSITGGGVTADKYSPEYGDNVVLTIMDDPDATLTSLTVNGDDVTSSIVGHQYTITSVSGNVSVVATWSSTKEFITLTTSTATFSCEQDLNFTGSELRAYIAAGYSKSGNGVLLVRVYDVPAHTGLVIRGEVGPTYKIPYSTSQSYFVNLLKAHLNTDEDVPATSDDENYYNYVLKRVEDVYSWHRPTSGTMTLAERKAYLQLPKSFMTAAAARELNLVFEDDSTTDISEFILLNNGKTGDRIYNLNGQQVDNMRKGVYIVNGRKVMK